jgi:hypothetical protein
MSWSAVNIIVDDEHLIARLLEVINAEVLKTQLFQEGDKLVECRLTHGQAATFLVQRLPETPLQWLSGGLGGSSSSQSEFVWTVEAPPFVPPPPQPSPSAFRKDAAVFVPGSVSASDSVSVLVQRLTTWLEENAEVMRMPDERTKRLAKELMVWSKISNSQSDIELPVDIFKEMLGNAVKLAEAGVSGSRNQQAGVGSGFLAMQKVLVVSSLMRKLQVIQHLRRSARKLLFHRYGCFVVSQILQEGIVCSASIDTDDNEYLGVAMAAVEFMEIAIDFASPHVENNLVNSIKCVHANHSLKLFVVLLASLERPHTDLVSAVSTSHLETILAFVVPNALSLVQDCQGVRIINVLLEELGRSQRVAPLLEALLADDLQLTILIADEFANYAISAALDAEHDRICQVVHQNFVEFAGHWYATHVVQKCIEVASDVWVIRFNELFIANSDKLASTQQRSSCVRRALELTLSTRKMRSHLQKLHTVRQKVGPMTL